jgi:hypothetical protein
MKDNYSTAEIRKIRELCIIFDCECFALDLLLSGLTVDEAERRLAEINAKMMKDARRK